MAYKTRKKKVKKNVPEGMAHIHLTTQLQQLQIKMEA